MSIWNKNETKRSANILNKNIETDILIIGGGITGMTTLYYLKDKNVCLVDSNRVGYGVTLNTTAKINYFQERIYTKIKTLKNEKCAVKYLNSQIFAINQLKNIINENNIECDFKQVKSYVFANKVSEITKLDKEVEFLKRNNIKVYKDNVPDIKSYKSYYVADTYVFNPIKYIEGLYKIVNKKIYENTKIIKIREVNGYYMCFTDKYFIRAKKVIIATHYPYFLLPLLFPLKTMIEKSYMIVTKVKKDYNYTCISSSKPTYSTRFYKLNNTLYQICLGSSHNTSIKQNDEYNFNKVKSMFNINDKNIIMTYSNVDIITADSMPYIGEIKKNMYISTGYNTWGMTNGVLGANIISDLILNKDNEFVEIFKPNRFNIGNIINLPIIIIGQIKSFIGPKINKNKSWYKRVKFINKGGKKIAIYKDKKGNKHIVYNKCPHLGCSLIFNAEENTWDCPCHSSRFDIDGKCIKGPSNYDISYNKKNKLY